MFCYHVISENPLVLVAYDYPNLFHMLDELRALEAWVFVYCSWTLEAADRPEFALRLAEWTEKCPRHHFVYLANSPKEKAILDRNGMPAIFCNHNSFIDERIFQILPDETKRFRAIYNARLTPFKRHFLAANVQGLALITYTAPANHDDAYVEQTRQALAQATWLNGSFTENQTTFDPKEVCRLLNQSRTGLILSKMEGGNFASIEYLLCGLPVVTTRNVGGRDVFFHPDYVVTVDDDPESVAAAVDELIKRDLDPCIIRKRTLAIMQVQRSTFLREIERILKGHGVNRDLEADWNRIFTNKMLLTHNRSDVQALARRGPVRQTQTNR